MGVLRGLSLASIVALPAFILGFIAYVAIANARGATIDATEWETWMFLPCYVLHVCSIHLWNKV